MGGGRRPFAVVAQIRYLGAVRTLSVLSLIALVLVSWSCTGSSTSSSSPATSVSPSAASTAERTAEPTSAASTPAASATGVGAIAEVTGIVGSISQATRIIQIDRLSGAPVVKIAIESSTVLRLAGGGTISLGDVHVSDRIVASGHLNDRQDTLVATSVTVQDVLPGAGPGG
jgi:hypothetical protein